MFFCKKFVKKIFLQKIWSKVNYYASLKENYCPLKFFYKSLFAKIGKTNFLPNTRSGKLLLGKLSEKNPFNPARKLFVQVRQLVHKKTLGAKKFLIKIAFFEKNFLPNFPSRKILFFIFLDNMIFYSANNDYPVCEDWG